MEEVQSLFNGLKWYPAMMLLYLLMSWSDDSYGIDIELHLTLEEAQDMFELMYSEVIAIRRGSYDPDEGGPSMQFYIAICNRILASFGENGYSVVIEELP